MILFLTKPNFSMNFIVFISICAPNVIPCWIPWCCGVFTGAVAARFFSFTTAALLAAADTEFVCIAIDTSTQHVHADEAKLSPLHAAVMGDIQTATRIDSKADIEIQAPARAV